jgi:hypothetical protein
MIALIRIAILVCVLHVFMHKLHQPKRRVTVTYVLYLVCAKMFNLLLPPINTAALGST